MEIILCIIGLIWWDIGITLHRILDEFRKK